MIDTNRHAYQRSGGGDTRGRGKGTTHSQSKARHATLLTSSSLDVPALQTPVASFQLGGKGESLGFEPTSLGLETLCFTTRPTPHSIDFSGLLLTVRFYSENSSTLVSLPPSTLQQAAN